MRKIIFQSKNRIVWDEVKDRIATCQVKRCRRKAIGVLDILHTPSEKESLLGNTVWWICGDHMKTSKIEDIKSEFRL